MEERHSWAKSLLRWFLVSISILSKIWISVRIQSARRGLTQEALGGLRALLIIYFPGSPFKAWLTFSSSEKNYMTSPAAVTIPSSSPTSVYIYIRAHITLYFNYLYVPFSLSHLSTDPVTQEAQNPKIPTGNHPGFQNRSQKQNLKPFACHLPPHHVSESQSTEQFLQSRKQ